MGLVERKIRSAISLCFSKLVLNLDQGKHGSPWSLIWSPLNNVDIKVSDAKSEACDKCSGLVFGENLTQWLSTGNMNILYFYIIIVHTSSKPAFIHTSYIQRACISIPVNLVWLLSFQRNWIETLKIYS